MGNTFTQHETEKKHKLEHNEIGNAFTHLLDAEKKTWEEHHIVFDHQVREENLKSLDCFKDGEEITLGSQINTLERFPYPHWFVTNGELFAEFGHTEATYSTAKVTINSHARKSYHSERKGQMDGDMRDRMRHVLGMSNYSLCLRNSEHVANYIFRGRWVSLQMDEAGALMKELLLSISKKDEWKVNTFPSDIRPHVFSVERKKLFSFTSNHYRAMQFNYYLDYNENTYNILVFGPTGAGKSHLINVLFNQEVCDENVSHKRVTKDVCFIRGKKEIHDIKENKNQIREIIVADTVGLYGTDKDEDKIRNLIKERVHQKFKAFDAVFVVFTADRLIDEQVQGIKKIMKSLFYEKEENHNKFMFVGTHAESLSEENKSKLSLQAKDIFGIKKTERNEHDQLEGGSQNLVYIGFPPEELLSEQGKDGVRRSWELLRPLLMVPSSTERPTGFYEDSGPRNFGPRFPAGGFRTEVVGPKIPDQTYSGRRIPGQEIPDRGVRPEDSGTRIPGQEISDRGVRPEDSGTRIPD